MTTVFRLAATCLRLVWPVVACIRRRYPAREAHFKVRKQPRPICPICTPLERHWGWRVDALRDALRSARDDGPGSTADVRRQRRRFEREMRASDADVAQIRPRGHRPITDAGAQRQWLNWLLEGHADLQLP